MSIDGVFIHNLINELKIIEQKRINKIYDLSENEFLLHLSNRQVLVASLNVNHPHLRLSSEHFQNLTTPSNFCMVLRKYFERGIIESISQYNNDRIVTIKVRQADELGYYKFRYLIFELLGRHANLILVDGEMMIIDCLRKTPLDSMRLLVPKVNYIYPESNKINPYTITNNDFDINELEGVSNILKTEIKYYNNIKFVLSKEVKPTLITTNDKYFFYWTDLVTLTGKRTFFNSLSDLLSYYFNTVTKTFLQTEQNKKIINFIKREIKKTTQKITKQELELQQAQENLVYEKLGNLLSSNLYRIKKGDSLIVLEDFYEDYQPIELILDPKLNPAENLESYFNKYKKARRTIEFLSEEIKKSREHLKYLETLQNQVQVSSDSDLEEIALELGLKKEQKKKKQVNKPNYLTFTDQEGNLIYIGKNNIQNNYLTHTLASKNDYFFHVKNSPGSHVIVRTNNLSEELIVLAAQLAAYYSNCLSKTTVDYTLVKYVKRVKGHHGSFVIYTNQKSVTITPDKEYFLSKLKES